MKIFSPLMCIALALAGVFTQTAQSQIFNQPLGGPVAQGAPSGVVPFQTNIRTAFPGRIWIGAKLADNGLGYSGSYVTLGGKTRLHEDVFDGRWLLESRLHVNSDHGGLFGNVGIERVFTLAPANADVAFGFWYDYDEDDGRSFSHGMNRLAISAAIKKEQFDIMGNGYFPVGDNDYVKGDPNNVLPFYGNELVVNPGIDSALRGFDAQVRVRPGQLGFVNGYVQAGVYGFQSDIVESFFGGRVRTGFQGLMGTHFDVEMNYDDRFHLTGYLQMSWVYGARGSGNEAFGQGRDLEQTLREEHVTRYHEDPLLALDPETGLPYVVHHVDNTAAAGGTGTFENPFSTLAEAQAAGANDSIVFVHRGDGTTTGMASGITLRPGQMLLGEGATQIVPLLDGRDFVFNPGTAGLMPTITGSGGAAVTLDTRGTVRGFNIDRLNSTVTHGIVGTGTAGSPLVDGTIGNVNMFNTADSSGFNSVASSGIHLGHITGDWVFSNLNIQDAFGYGVRIENSYGSTSSLTFTNSTISENNLSGILIGDNGTGAIETYDGDTFTFTDVVTSNNGGNGIELANYANSSGLGGTWTFTRPIASVNNESGIVLDRTDGNVFVIDPTLTNNSAHGISLIDVRNSISGTVTSISTSETPTIDPLTNLVVTTSIITGNGASSNPAAAVGPMGVIDPSNRTSAGDGINVELNSGIQRLLVSHTILDGNGVGIFARASNGGTSLTSTVLNNISINGTFSDAVRFIASEGATHNVLLENEASFVVPTLSMTGISASNGVGLAFFSEHSTSNTTMMDVVLRNLNIQSVSSAQDTAGIFARSGRHISSIGGNQVVASGNAQMDLTLENITLARTASTNAIHTIFDNNNSLMNQLYVKDVTVTPTGGGSGSAANAFSLANRGSSVFDLEVAGSGLVDAYLDNFQAVHTIPAGSISTGAGIGLLATAANTTQLRLNVKNSTFNGFQSDGVHVESQNTARVLANFVGNVANDNGVSGQTAWTFDSGFFFGARGASQLDLNFVQNSATRNWEAGLELQTIGNSLLNAYVSGNTLNANDLGDDMASPLTEAGIQDVLIVNGPWSPPTLVDNMNVPLPGTVPPGAGIGTVNVEFTNTFTTLGTDLWGNGGTINYQLDASTNLGGVNERSGAATFVSGFETIATPGINATKGVFGGLGFPPVN